MPNYVLGIELGITSINVSIVNTDTNETEDQFTQETDSDIPGDVDGANKQYVPKIIEVLNTCVENIQAVYRQNVSMIAVCGQLHGVVLWTLARDGPPWKFKKNSYEIDAQKVSNLYTRKDGRCSKEFLASLPQPESHVELETGFGIPTIFWLSQHSPHHLRKYNRSGLISSFVVAMLCDMDDVFTTYQSAPTWGYFDCNTLQWNYEILEAADFPMYLLPEVVPPGFFAGRLAQSWNGIPVGIPVGADLGDMQCSIISTIDTLEDAIFEFSDSVKIAFVTDDHCSFDPHDQNSACPSGRENVRFWPFFNDMYIGVAESSNGGCIIEVFVNMLQRWFIDLGVSVPREKIWSTLINIDVEDAESRLRIIPTCVGETYSSKATGTVVNITGTNLSLAEVFKVLCAGIVNNLHDQISAEKLKKTNCYRLLCNASNSYINELLRSEVERVYRLPLVFIDKIEASKGAALALHIYGNVDELMERPTDNAMHHQYPPSGEGGIQYYPPQHEPALDNRPPETFDYQGRYTGQERHIEQDKYVDQKRRTVQERYVDQVRYTSQERYPAQDMYANQVERSEYIEQEGYIEEEIEETNFPLDDKPLKFYLKEFHPTEYASNEFTDSPRKVSPLITSGYQSANQSQQIYDTDQQLGNINHSGSVDIEQKDYDFSFYIRNQEQLDASRTPRTPHNTLESDKYEAFPRGQTDSQMKGKPNYPTSYTASPQQLFPVNVNDTQKPNAKESDRFPRKNARPSTDDLSISSAPKRGFVYPDADSQRWPLPQRSAQEDYVTKKTSDSKQIPQIASADYRAHLASTTHHHSDPNNYFVQEQNASYPPEDHTNHRRNTPYLSPDDEDLPEEPYPENLYTNSKTTRNNPNLDPRANPNEPYSEKPTQNNLYPDSQGRHPERYPNVSHNDPRIVQSRQGYRADNAQPRNPAMDSSQKPSARDFQQGQSAAFDRQQNPNTSRKGPPYTDSQNIPKNSHPPLPAYSSKTSPQKLDPTFQRYIYMDDANPEDYPIQGGRFPSSRPNQNYPGVQASDAGYSGQRDVPARRQMDGRPGEKNYYQSQQIGPLPINMIEEQLAANRRNQTYPVEDDNYEPQPGVQSQFEPKGYLHTNPQQKNDYSFSNTSRSANSRVDEYRDNYYKNQQRGSDSQRGPPEAGISNYYAQEENYQQKASTYPASQRPPPKMMPGRADQYPNRQDPSRRGYPYSEPQRAQASVKVKTNTENYPVDPTPRLDFKTKGYPFQEAQATPKTGLAETSSKGYPETYSRSAPKPSGRSDLHTHDSSCPLRGMESPGKLDGSKFMAQKNSPFKPDPSSKAYSYPGAVRTPSPEVSTSTRQYTSQKQYDSYNRANFQGTQPTPTGRTDVSPERTQQNNSFKPDLSAKRSPYADSRGAPAQPPTAGSPAYEPQQGFAFKTDAPSKKYQQPDKPGATATPDRGKYLFLEQQVDASGEYVSESDNLFQTEPSLKDYSSRGPQRSQQTTSGRTADSGRYIAQQGIPVKFGSSSKECLPQGAPMMMPSQQRYPPKTDSSTRRHSYSEPKRQPTTSERPDTEKYVPSQTDNAKRYPYQESQRTQSSAAERAEFEIFSPQPDSPQKFDSPGKRYSYETQRNQPLRPVDGKLAPQQVYPSKSDGTQYQESQKIERTIPGSYASPQKMHSASGKPEAEKYAQQKVYPQASDRQEYPVSQKSRTTSAKPGIEKYDSQQKMQPAPGAPDTEKYAQQKVYPQTSERKEYPVSQKSQTTSGKPDPEKYVKHKDYPPPPEKPCEYPESQKIKPSATGRSDLEKHAPQQSAFLKPDSSEMVKMQRSPDRSDEKYAPQQKPERKEYVESQKVPSTTAGKSDADRFQQKPSKIPASTTKPFNTESREASTSPTQKLNGDTPKAPSSSQTSKAAGAPSSIPVASSERVPKMASPQPSPPKANDPATQPAEPPPIQKRAFEKYTEESQTQQTPQDDMKYNEYQRRPQTAPSSSAAREASASRINDAVPRHRRRRGRQLDNDMQFMEEGTLFSEWAPPKTFLTPSATSTYHLDDDEFPLEDEPSEDEPQRPFDYSSYYYDYTTLVDNSYPRSYEITGTYTAKKLDSKAGSSNQDTRLIPRSAILKNSDVSLNDIPRLVSSGNDVEGTSNLELQGRKIFPSRSSRQYSIPSTDEGASTSLRLLRGEKMFAYAGYHQFSSPIEKESLLSLAGPSGTSSANDNSTVNNQTFLVRQERKTLSPTTSSPHKSFTDYTRRITKASDQNTPTSREKENLLSVSTAPANSNADDTRARLVAFEYQIMIQPSEAEHLLSPSKSTIKSSVDNNGRRQVPFDGQTMLTPSENENLFSFDVDTFPTRSEADDNRTLQPRETENKLTSSKSYINWSVNDHRDSLLSKDDQDMLEQIERENLLPISAVPNPNTDYGCRVNLSDDEEESPSNERNHLLSTSAPPAKSTRTVYSKYKFPLRNNKSVSFLPHDIDPGALSQTPSPDTENTASLTLEAEDLPSSGNYSTQHSTEGNPAANTWSTTTVASYMGSVLLGNRNYILNPAPTGSTPQDISLTSSSPTVYNSIDSESLTNRCSTNNHPMPSNAQNAPNDPNAPNPPCAQDAIACRCL